MSQDQRNFQRILEQVDARLARIERYAWILLRVARREEIAQMADQQTLDRLTRDVQANTDATRAAAAALTGFVATVTDLTAKLQEAIAGGDEGAIVNAANAIEANNATLTAAIPVVSAAVVENT